MRTKFTPANLQFYNISYFCDVSMSEIRYLVLVRSLVWTVLTYGAEGWTLVKCVIQGKVSGKQRRGRPKTSYSSNITKWMTESMERITRITRDRAEWRRLVRCAARAANHHSWWDSERRCRLVLINREISAESTPTRASWMRSAGQVWPGPAVVHRFVGMLARHAASSQLK